MKRVKKKYIPHAEAIFLKTQPTSNLGEEAMEHASLYSVFRFACAPAPVSGV